ncbi:hypothetical protein BDP27DRAFT_1420526 [Rhodocollybia butyracea]|uniref:Uncharacterized protein n=1 Tax=Rhodocollybia butyracea TaxID=206335 RepID=A0A9P5PVD5_9AGAR|nr:hypothetical protein BDP27DRAFT_1420526 [Rhodocollybia butyracea]
MHPIVFPSSQSSESPMYQPQDSNSLIDAPPRLLSPFELASGFQTLEKPGQSSSSRAQRRRHCAREECPMQSSSSSAHTFDKLSWISAMDTTSEDHGLSDIADLSQLPVDDAKSRAGPVRRRKTSSHRTSPVRAASGSSIQPTYYASVLRHRPIPVPSSPRPRPSRSRVAFHDLMPLFTCDIHKYRTSNPSSPAH